MSAAAPPRVHLERFAVGSDAIEANRHANNKEYLHWKESIAIGGGCPAPTKRTAPDAGSTSAYVIVAISSGATTRRTASACATMSAGLCPSSA